MRVDMPNFSPDIQASLAQQTARARCWHGMGHMHMGMSGTIMIPMTLYFIQRLRLIGPLDQPTVHIQIYLIFLYIYKFIEFNN